MGFDSAKVKHKGFCLIFSPLSGLEQVSKPHIPDSTAELALVMDKVQQHPTLVHAQTCGR